MEPANVAFICIFLSLCVANSVAMTTFGILDFNLCPGDTRLAIYMIVQGATSVVLPFLAFWYCCKCISGKIITAICVTIGLFNISWASVGTYWLTHSTFPCNDTLLYNAAFLLTILMWISLCLVSLCCSCYMVARCD